LGIKVYESTNDNYYDLIHTKNNSGRAEDLDYWLYNSDNCIIECMGIGIVSANAEPDDDTPDPIESTDTAEYHTDTDVYTSFTIENIGDTPFIGDVTFSITNDDGETPMIKETLDPDNEEVYKITPGYRGPPTYHKGYTSSDTIYEYVDEDDSVRVYTDNPDSDNYEYGIKSADYRYVGMYKDESEEIEGTGEG